MLANVFLDGVRANLRDLPINDAREFIHDDHAVLLLTKAAATEIGVSRLVLDQLLWWSEN